MACTRCEAGAAIERGEIYLPQNVYIIQEARP